MTCTMQLATFALLVFVAASNSLLLSDIGTTGFGYGVWTYTSLTRTSSLAAPLLCAACISGFALHVMNSQDGQQQLIRKVLLGIVVLYIFLAACLSLTRTFPVMPAIVGTLHIPLALLLARGTLARSCLVTQFYRVVGRFSALFSVLLLASWCSKIAASNSKWDAEQESLHRALQDLYNEHDLVDRRTCEEVEVDDCSKLELVAFLLWFAPVIESGVFMLIALFSVFRAWFLSKHQLHQLAIVIHILLGFVASLAGAFWVSTSISGINREMSLAILAFVGLSCFGVLVWVYYSLLLGDMLAIALDNAYVHMLGPLVASDEFKGAVFSAAVFLVFPFLVLETGVRLCQRMLRLPGKHPFFTTRALRLLQVVEDWNWRTVLEQAFWWEVFFILFWVCCSLCAVVFLAWLRDSLSGMEFAPFCVLFYVALLIIFSCAPIPGIPIYACCGFTFATKSHGDHGFLSLFLMAFAMACMLKLSALTIQQMLFGKLLARSVRVQQAMGLHRRWVPAMQKLLSREGSYATKVLIVCGGPDLPTPVLAGIFGIPWCKLLTHFIPIIGIIFPCVLAGTLMVEDSWFMLSRAIIAAVTFVQGALMVGACLKILHFMSKDSEHLASMRESTLDRLFTLVRQQAQVEKVYSLCSEWQTLTPSSKFLLIVAASMEAFCCWVIFLFSSWCFRKFYISSEFHAPVNEEGLDGNPWNVVTPFGCAILSLAGCGMIVMCIYFALMRRRMRKVGHFLVHMRAQCSWSHLRRLSMSSNPAASEFGESSSWNIEVEVDGPLVIQSLVFKGTPRFGRRLELAKKYLQADATAGKN